MLKCVAISLLLAGAIGACSGEMASSNKAANVPIMDGAYNVGSVGNDNFYQQYYDINATYPSMNALDFYDKYFAGNGWKRCVGGIEKWWSFIDMTGESEKMVHQVVHYFINEDEKTGGVIVLRYESKKWSGARKGIPSEEDIPDSDVQHVNIVIELNADLQQWQQGLSLSCKVGKE
ncbi:hypothetical protein AGMMS50225_14540 [Betaproteobacteria bacterium]|nr:hypothetical protein AGMMS50225_14540 [Betaproteobacteria bacterium]